jgi:hypothetical protein
MAKVSEKIFDVNNQQGATTECERLLWLPLDEIGSRYGEI